jgi:hypothetical protein
LTAFSSTGVHSASNRKDYQEISCCGEWLPARRCDNFAVQVVPNVKINDGEAQPFISHLSLSDLLGKALPLPSVRLNGADIHKSGFADAFGTLLM